MNDELEDKLKNKLSGANFTVPESYFNDLSERIQTRLSLEQMVNHSDHHGFKVPDLYFEQDITSGLRCKASKNGQMVEFRSA
eukprot:gene13010-15886_t